MKPCAHAIDRSTSCARNSRGRCVLLPTAREAHDARESCSALGLFKNLKASRMPLTLAQLEDIQADCLADDVAIDFEKMRLWTEADAVAFFESGGTVEPTPAAVPLGRKPRIALLHGTVSNTNIFKMQTAALLRALQAWGAEIHIVEAPLECEEDNPQLAKMKEFFGPNSSYLEYARSTSDQRNWRTYTLDTLEAALAHCESSIAEAFPETGADALIGFSQGAHLITLLAARAERAGRPLRAALMLSMSLPGWVLQKPDLFAEPLATPAFIGWSPSDRLLYHAKTNACGPHENAKLFASVVLREHNGPGHRPLPKDRGECESFVEEMRAFLAAYCPE